MRDTSKELRGELDLAVSSGELSQKLADEILRDTENAVKIGRQMDAVIGKLFPGRAMK